MLFRSELNNPGQASKSEAKTSVSQTYKKGIKEFSQYLGTKVDVKVTKKGSGKLTIPFSSEEDFIRLQKLIKGEE